MRIKYPTNVTDQRAKYFYAKILGLMPDNIESDQFIFAQLSNAMANCEKAQKDIDENGFKVITSTTVKASPSLEMLKSQQLTVRNLLKELGLTPSARGQIESDTDNGDDDFDKYISSK